MLAVFEAWTAVAGLMDRQDLRCWNSNTEYKIVFRKVMSQGQRVHQNGDAMREQDAGSWSDCSCRQGLCMQRCAIHKISERIFEARDRKRLLTVTTLCMTGDGLAVGSE